MKPKTIAIVANWDWVIYNFRLPLAKSLADSGLQVVLVCPPGEYTAQLQATGFPLVLWKLNRRSTNPFSELSSLLELIRIYRDNAFDAVHHFTVKPILYGSIAARIANVPIAINNFTGLGYLFSSSLLARFLRTLLLPLYRLALNARSTHTIFQNPAVRDELIRRKVVTPQRTSIIAGTGVDLSKFETNARQKGDTPKVLMAARLLADKGVGEYVHAARILREKGHSVDFLLAGKADYGNPAAISEKQLQDWREQSNVQFLGHHSDMPALLKDVDLAVLPSYHEGVPLFLLEAAAASLPIVATDIEGNRAVVQEGVNGYLVPPRDAQGLAEAIENLLEDESLRRELGRASRRIAKERFNADLINQQYLEIYRRLGILAS